MLSPLLVPFIIIAPAGLAPASFGKETVLLKDHPAPFVRTTITDEGKFLFALDRTRCRIRDMATGVWRSLGIAGPEWLAVSGDGKLLRIHCLTMT